MGRRLAPGGHELPDEVGELLGAVRVPPGCLQQAVERDVGDRSAGLLEAPPDEGCEFAARDRPDLELLRAAPERLVLVVEDALEQVALAAEVDMADLGLGLEDGAHQVREVPVERKDLLELVEDEHHAPLALDGELARQFEQALDRLVDVRFPPSGLEAETEAAVARINLERRPDPEAAEEVGGTLEAALGGRRDLGMDRLRERGREAFLRQGLHQVAVADECLLADHLLGGPQDERRLAGAARRRARSGRCACPR